MHYYNEVDPLLCKWLENLIEDDWLPKGVVDCRPIEEVSPQDVKGFDQCHFFAGVGGWPLAVRWAGYEKTKGLWTGSCPCQPFSTAGKGLGLADDRHVWPHFYRLIKELKPTVCFGEQVGKKGGYEWFDHVSSDLEESDYAVGSANLCAASEGAPHIRQRLFWVAYSEWHKQPWKEPRSWPSGRMGRKQQPLPWDRPWQSALSELRVLDDGLPRRVAATDAARNALVPQVAKTFIEGFFEAVG